jgi:hypothetical protein
VPVALGAERLARACRGFVCLQHHSALTRQELRHTVLQDQTLVKRFYRINVSSFGGSAGV